MRRIFEMNVVKCKHITKTWKDFSIKDVHLTIPKGYITGFIGPNGSGKTTTIQLMMDLLRLDSGHITLFGQPHTNNTVKQRIGFVYDDLFMYEDFTIKKMKAFIAPIYDNWNETLFNELLERFELPVRKKLKTFSKGMKVKCSLLFALAHEPELIIMDEPTAGLDPIFRKELLQILQEIMIREEQTIFLSTHITSDLDNIADYVVLLNHGEVVFQQSIEEIKEQYHIIKGKKALLDSDIRSLFLHVEETNSGFQALFKGNLKIFEPFDEEVIIETATLDELMFFIVKGEKNEDRKSVV